MYAAFEQLRYMLSKARRRAADAAQENLANAFEQALKTLDKAILASESPEAVFKQLQTELSGEAIRFYKPLRKFFEAPERILEGFRTTEELVRGAHPTLLQRINEAYLTQLAEKAKIFMNKQATDIEARLEVAALQQQIAGSLEEYLKQTQGFGEVVSEAVRKIIGGGRPEEAIELIRGQLRPGEAFEKLPAGIRSAIEQFEQEISARVQKLATDESFATFAQFARHIPETYEPAAAIDAAKLVTKWVSSKISTEVAQTMRAKGVTGLSIDFYLTFIAPLGEFMEALQQGNKTALELVNKMGLNSPADIAEAIKKLHVIMNYDTNKLLDKKNIYPVFSIYMYAGRIPEATETALKNLRTALKNAQLYYVEKKDIQQLAKAARDMKNASTLESDMLNPTGFIEVWQLEQVAKRIGAQPDKLLVDIFEQIKRAETFDTEIIVKGPRGEATWTFNELLQKLLPEIAPSERGTQLETLAGLQKALKLFKPEQLLGMPQSEAETVVKVLKTTAEHENELIEALAGQIPEGITSFMALKQYITASRVAKRGTTEVWDILKGEGSIIRKTLTAYAVSSGEVPEDILKTLYPHYQETLKAFTEVEKTPEELITEYKRLIEEVSAKISAPEEITEAGAEEEISAQAKEMMAKHFFEYIPPGVVIHGRERGALVIALATPTGKLYAQPTLRRLRHFARMMFEGPHAPSQFEQEMRIPVGWEIERIRELGMRPLSKELPLPRGIYVEPKLAPRKQALEYIVASIARQGYEIPEEVLKTIDTPEQLIDEIAKRIKKPITFEFAGYRAAIVPAEWLDILSVSSPNRPGQNVILKLPGEPAGQFQRLANVFAAVTSPERAVTSFWRMSPLIRVYPKRMAEKAMFGIPPQAGSESRTKIRRLLEDVFARRERLTLRDEQRIAEELDMPLHAITLFLGKSHEETETLLHMITGIPISPEGDAILAQRLLFEEAAMVNFGPGTITEKQLAKLDRIFKLSGEARQKGIVPVMWRTEEVNVFVEMEMEGQRLLLPIQAILNTQGKRENKAAVIGSAALRLGTLLQKHEFPLSEKFVSSLQKAKELISQGYAENILAAKEALNAALETMKGEIVIRRMVREGQYEWIRTGIQGLVGIHRFYVDVSQRYGSKLAGVAIEYPQVLPYLRLSGLKAVTKLLTAADIQQFDLMNKLGEGAAGGDSLQTLERLFKLKTNMQDLTSLEDLLWGLQLHASLFLEGTRIGIWEPRALKQAFAKRGWSYEEGMKRVLRQLRKVFGSLGMPPEHTEGLFDRELLEVFEEETFEELERFLKTATWAPKREAQLQLQAIWGLKPARSKGGAYYVPEKIVEKFFETRVSDQMLVQKTIDLIKSSAPEIAEGLRRYLTTIEALENLSAVQTPTISGRLVVPPSIAKEILKLSGMEVSVPLPFELIRSMKQLQELPLAPAPIQELASRFLRHVRRVEIAPGTELGVMRVKLPQLIQVKPAGEGQLEYILAPETTFFKRALIEGQLEAYRTSWITQISGRLSSLTTARWSQFGVQLAKYTAQRLNALMMALTRERGVAITQRHVTLASEIPGVTVPIRQFRRLFEDEWWFKRYARMAMVVDTTPNGFVVDLHPKAQKFVNRDELKRFFSLNFPNIPVQIRFAADAEEFEQKLRSQLQQFVEVHENLNRKFKRDIEKLMKRTHVKSAKRLVETVPKEAKEPFGPLLKHKFVQEYLNYNSPELWGLFVRHPVQGHLPLTRVVAATEQDVLGAPKWLAQAIGGDDDGDMIKFVPALILTNEAKQALYTQLDAMAPEARFVFESGVSDITLATEIQSKSAATDINEVVKAILSSRAAKLPEFLQAENITEEVMSQAQQILGTDISVYAPYIPPGWGKRPRLKIHPGQMRMFGKPENPTKRI